MNRRELLAALIGLPGLLPGCYRRSTPSLPEGAIVGASAGIGHRLRDGFRPVPPPDAWQNRTVVIVGAGVAGLVAAWRLARAGLNDFELIELEPVAGGTARSGTSKVVGYPWGAHYIPAPTKENRLLVTILDELGVFEGTDEAGQPVVKEQYLCREPEERVFYLGQWHEGLFVHAGATPEDESQWRRFQAEIDRFVGWRDARGRRAFAIPVAHCSDDADITQLDRITMADWLDQNGFTSRRLRWLVNYACRDDYGMTIEQTSAWAGLFYFAARVPKPGASSQPFITWAEGNGWVVNRLFRKFRDRSKLGFAVSDIVPREDGADVIAVDSEGRQAIGRRARFVIFAAPHFLTRYLIRSYRDDPPRHLQEFEYGSWFVANLHLRERPYGRGFPLCWDNVIYDSPSLGYVCATHQALLDYGPTVLTYYYPICEDNPTRGREKLLAWDWSTCAELCLSDMERAHPNIRDLTQRLDVMRWGHAMIQPRPGFIWGRSRQDAQQAFGPIHFAHTDLSGVPLFEEAAYHGIRAAEEILKRHGMNTRSLLSD
ncbi:MAG: monooxygenase [Gemmatales bacterium]|nr:MAG: monooxygenase [Gemmatales bacterium]